MDAKLARYTAVLWVLVGVLGLCFVGAFAISHFVFGVPVYVGNSGALAATWQISGLCVVLAVGFCSLGVMGAYRIIRGNPTREADQHPSRFIDRACAILYWPALVLAWIDAVLVPASFTGFPRLVLQAALWTTGALAAVHFFLMLFDGPTRRAINAYNSRMLERATKRLPRQDPFGSLKNSSVLKLTIVILGGEMLMATLVHGQSPEPPVDAALAFSAAFLTIIIALLQIKTVPNPKA